MQLKLLKFLKNLKTPPNCPYDFHMDTPLIQHIVLAVINTSIIILIFKICVKCIILPAKCKGVEFRPWASLQLILSDVTNLCTRTRLPFFAASKSAALPRKRSATSWSPSRTKSNGVAPSRFFLLGSAPCWNQKAISF